MTENEMVDRIIKSLEEEPEKWEIDDHSAKNGPLRIWTALWWPVHIYQPAEIRLGFWNKRRVRRAVKECARYQVALALDAPTATQDAPGGQTTPKEGDCTTED